MAVDNHLYDANADRWWDENNFLHLLKLTLNPARFGYFFDIANLRGIDLQGKRVLDIGCGGGFLAEEFARAGCLVSGIDISAASLAAARLHAEQNGLVIDYRVAAAESIPFAGLTFDIVVCCDVLEHVSDLDRVVRESARVLKAGGLYFYDTVNRTPMSWLAAIFLAQAFPLTRIFPRNTHDWRQFIRPAELHALMRRYGIANAETLGLNPPIPPVFHVGLLLAVNRGRLSYPEYGRRSRFELSRSLAMSYIGYGVKSS
jgi:2-polyprenyl-6-hydroxyphenyl methylase/3-demethylubiquinone-9 3-methyltransferase